MFLWLSAVCYVYMSVIYCGRSVWWRGDETSGAQTYWWNSA